MHVKDLLQNAVYKAASDIFIVAGLPASYRIEGTIVRENDTKLMPADTAAYLSQIYELAGNRDMK